MYTTYNKIYFLQFFTSFCTAWLVFKKTNSRSCHFVLKYYKYPPFVRVYDTWFKSFQAFVCYHVHTWHACIHTNEHIFAFTMTILLTSLDHPITHSPLQNRLSNWESSVHDDKLTVFSLMTTIIIRRSVFHKFCSGKAVEFGAYLSPLENCHSSIQLRSFQQKWIGILLTTDV